MVNLLANYNFWAKGTIFEVVVVGGGGSRASNCPGMAGTVPVF